MHNISAEAILESKRELAVPTGIVVQQFCQAFPALGPDDALWAAQSIALYVGSLWPAAFPSATARAVLALPELAGVKPEFERDLERFVTVLFRGLLVRDG